LITSCAGTSPAQNALFYSANSPMLTNHHGNLKPTLARQIRKNLFTMTKSRSHKGNITLRQFCRRQGIYHSRNETGATSTRPKHRPLRPLPEPAVAGARQGPTK